MAAETDAFVIATFALWAGDTQHADELFAQFAPLQPRPLATLTSIDSPIQVIAATAALRRRQLAAKTREFKRIVSKRSDELGGLTDAPAVIQTKHLRATIWRRSPRQFLMKGYLTDLDWESRLFTLARKAAQTAVARKKGAKPTPSRESHEGVGASWAVEGVLFIEIDVTELGQIEANAIWTRREFPPDASQIKAPFEALLQSLDRPVGRDEVADEMTE